jgi:hypothetical protein
MHEEDVRSLVDGIVDAWKERDLDRFMGFLDDHVIWEDPAMLVGPATGRDRVREFCVGLLRAFPDFDYRIREPICLSRSGSRCVVPWEIMATHTGRFEPLGFAPTRQAVTMHGVDVLEIVGNKVARIETHFNVLAAGEQVLRLTPFSKRGLSKMPILWLQRCRALWLRLTTRKETSGVGTRQ